MFHWKQTALVFLCIQKGVPRGSLEFTLRGPSRRKELEHGEERENLVTQIMKPNLTLQLRRVLSRQGLIIWLWLSCNSGLCVDQA